MQPLMFFYMKEPIVIYRVNELSYQNPSLVSAQKRFFVENPHIIEKILIKEFWKN